MVSAAMADGREKGSLSARSAAGTEPAIGLNPGAGLRFCMGDLRLGGKRLAQGHTADSRQT